MYPFSILRTIVCRNVRRIASTVSRERQIWFVQDNLVSGIMLSFAGKLIGFIVHLITDSVLTKNATLP